MQSGIWPPKISVNIRSDLQIGPDRLDWNPGIQDLCMLRGFLDGSSCSSPSINKVVKSGFAVNLAVLTVLASHTSLCNLTLSRNRLLVIQTSLAGKSEYELDILFSAMPSTDFLQTQTLSPLIEAKVSTFDPYASCDWSLDPWT